jgi:hypothetical protein
MKKSILWFAAGIGAFAMLLYFGVYRAPGSPAIVQTSGNPGTLTI